MARIKTTLYQATCKFLLARGASQGTPPPLPISRRSPQIADIRHRTDLAGLPHERLVDIFVPGAPDAPAERIRARACPWGAGRRHQNRPNKKKPTRLRPGKARRAPREHLFNVVSRPCEWVLPGDTRARTCPGIASRTLSTTDARSIPQTSYPSSQLPTLKSDHPPGRVWKSPPPATYAESACPGIPAPAPVRPPRLHPSRVGGAGMPRRRRRCLPRSRPARVRREARGLSRERPNAALRQSHFSGGGCSGNVSPNGEADGALRMDAPTASG